MLTHANLMYQVSNLSFFIRPLPGERTLSLLPPWHIYERAVGYFVFACGVTQACHSAGLSGPWSERADAQAHV